MKTSHLFCSLLLLPLIAMPLTAAEMYKCEGEGGVPLYQNFPCEEGKEIRNMSKDESTVSVIPMKPQPSKLTPITPPPEPLPSVTPAQPAAPAIPPSNVSGTMPTPVSTPEPPQMPLIDLTKTPVVNVPENPQAVPSQNFGMPVSPADLAAPALEPAAVVPANTSMPTTPTDPAAMPAPLGIVGQARTAIKTGMTETDIETKLGPPPMTAGDPSAPEQPKRWFYLPTEGDPDTITTIHLHHGKVTQVERKPVKR